MSRFQKHLFFCVNERPSDKPKSCCSRQGSAELAAYAKQRVRGMGMQGTVRINKAGCLDACAYGPAVVVYPDGVWYSPRTQADIYFMPDQYNNPANWKAHFETTAKEIWAQTEGRVTHFLAGIGTGGTIMGGSRGLRQFNPDIKCYAIEPAEELHGIEGLKHMGSSIVPGIYDESILDGKISITTEDSYDMVSTLEKEEGILVGHSSAAAMMGALELASRIKKGVIVTVFPDSCEKCYINFGHFKEYAKTHSRKLPKHDAQ